MKPIGPLMKEHRVIERMIALLDAEWRRISFRQEADILFLANAVDFFRTYADRTHHGKEEDILFKELEGKGLEKELHRLMDELIAEHKMARGLVSGLNTAMISYAGGDRNSLLDIIEHLRKLTVFYPAHIEKEDKHFFFPAQEYFSQQQQDAMLQAFWEFDKKMIHEKYTRLIEEMKVRLSRTEEDKTAFTNNKKSR